MEPDRAKEIIRSLADDRDPATGQAFPPDARAESQGNACRPESMPSAKPATLQSLALFLNAVKRSPVCLWQIRLSAFSRAAGLFALATGGVNTRSMMSDFGS